MTINADSLLSIKEVLELYANNGGVHVMVVVESNETESEIPFAQFGNYTIANKSCREDVLLKGGGGGGVVIYIHNSVPYLPEADQFA